MKSLLILLLSVSVVLAERDARYPGLPDFGVRFNGNSSKEACDARVRTIMSKLECERFALRGPSGITYGLPNGKIRGTATLGDAYSYFDKPTEVVMYDGSYHVLHHELTHVYRNSYAIQRCSLPHNIFLNEGLAEMVSWSIDPDGMKVGWRDEWLREWVKRSGNWKKFRDQIGLAIDREPSSEDYALAGFFACQWMSCFPESKYEDAMEILALDSGNAQATEARMNALLARQKITPEDFWKKVWENAKEWTKVTK